MRLSPLAPLVVVAPLLFGGCLQSATLIKVNPDGSGTVEERLLMTKAAIAQLSQLTAMGGDKAKPFDPFKEEDARKAAADLGPDVTFVSSTPIKTDAAEGRAIVYAFPDIRKLKVNQAPSAGSMKIGGQTDTRPEKSGERLRFDFARTPADTALLTIMMPPFKTQADSMAAATGANSPAQLALVKQLFAGMRIVVAVQPAGRIIKSSSPYVDGQTVTLLDLPVDRLLENESALTALQQSKSIEDVKAALKGIPDLKVALDPQITIEFAAK